MKPLRTAAVLGAGAVGRALLRALPRAGVRITARWTRSAGGPIPPLSSAEVIFLAVSDAAVAPLAADLVVRRGQLVAHLAGALDLGPLAAARRKGARTGSMHPLRAFTRGDEFRGAAAGIDGSDASARSQLSHLARRLGMTPLEAGGRSRTPRPCWLQAPRLRSSPRRCARFARRRGPPSRLPALLSCPWPSAHWRSCAGSRQREPSPAPPPAETQPPSLLTARRCRRTWFRSTTSSPRRC